MARIRTIKPEFPQSESMGRVSRDARLTFVQLFTLADDEGRLRGNSRMLASLLFPYDDDAPGLIDGWLGELEKEQCVHRYQVEGQSYLQILKWLNHQKIDHSSKSKIPPPNIDSRTFASAREDSPLDQGSRIKDQGEEKTSAKSKKPPAPKVAWDGKEFSVPEILLDVWRKAYPAVNLQAEINAAAAWLISNPANAKSNYSRYLTNWLKRAQDRAPKAGGATPAPTKTWRDSREGIATKAAEFKLDITGMQRLEALSAIDNAIIDRNAGLRT